MLEERKEKKPLFRAKGKRRKEYLPLEKGKKPWGERTDIILT